MSRHSKIFRSFMISYIVILIIPSLAGYMSYRTSIAVTQSVSIENSVTQLQKSQQMLERRMAEVEGFSRQLALNQDLYVLMNEKKGTDDGNVYGIWKIMKEVMVFGQTNDFLKNYYIYLRNYNVVLTPGSAYFRPEHYYENDHYTEMDLGQWQSEVLDKTHSREILPLKPFMMNGSQTSVISYMQSLPLDSFGEQPPAAVVVLIDQKTIASLLSGVMDRYGGWTYVSNEAGDAISLNGIGESDIKTMNADSAFDKSKQSQFFKDDLVITIRSDSTGWIYRAGIPRKTLMENANRIKYITWSVTGGALAIGLIAGWFLSVRNSAPINRLLGIVREQFGKDAPIGRNAYDFLQGNIATIITSNRELEQELNRQVPLIRDAFLKRLIAGEFQTREEIQAAAAQADTGLALQEGFVGILHVHGYAGLDTVEILNELSAARLLLKQSLREVDTRILMTDFGSDRVVAIFPTGEGEEASGIAGRSGIQALLEPFAAFMFGEYKITVTGSLGDHFASDMEVSRSFEQAKETMAYADYMQRKGFLWFADIRQESTTYYYPLDMELRLISTVRAGEEEEAKRIVQSVLQQNTEERELSPEMANQLVGELKGTLLKLLDQKAFSESERFEEAKQHIMDIQLTGSIDAIRSELHGIIEAMCRMIANKKNDLHIKTVEAIKQFVAERYSDAELTLYRIAEQAERPEKYISQLFKEVTGTNLSDHLEKVRMDHAAAMLQDKSLTVDEIAVRVGYNSAHSFRRAFKRVMGVAPSAYRQSLD
ncbi:helix-turn-helix transcriptional regulator [Paenibacillus rhizovicinus]|uniref:Helix-turn-helix transcriptional regulator n=1 Tax=Paenibacillus rhizovicinus TaxID=2704463 RepID=A0A6C0P047_9BACL|nr:AraC family transcriptional regulator [Paenibacillus rhizovicinus]QHW31855.1 helix-turn-helix transcriptional regulator [Paenibacillus rhizovicinus]